MAEPFVWGAGGAQMTPEQIAAQRKVAQAMLERGGDYSPVGHWTQGAARVAQALAGGLQNRWASEAEQANVAADKDMIAQWFGGGQKPAVVPAAATAGAVPPAPSPAAPAAPSAPVVMGANGPAKQVEPGVYGPDAIMMPPVTPTAAPSSYGAAIAGIETPGSKDPYTAVGPPTRTGARAYGKYQVMDFNIPTWTKEVIGAEMTPQQFAASPEAQEKVFAAKFGEYVQKYGNPQDAASMWFTGKPAAQGAGARAMTPEGVPYGPTGRSYVDMFTKKLGPTGAPAETPALALSATPAPAVPAPVAAPPVAASPGAATVAAASTAPAGINPSLVKALTSPYTSEGTKKIAQIMLQHQMAGDAVTHVDLGGSVGIMDKRGNIIKTVQKTEPTKAPTIVDGPIDPATGEPTKLLLRGDGKYERVTLPEATPGAPATVTGPDGKPIVIPPGVDRKKFRADVTSATADAVTGKKTEVQAKSEKFGNKMELAERNLGQLDKFDEKTMKPMDEIHGPKVAGRLTEYLPGGNLIQSEGYQKYRQARDNFITALLRDESGAAIGTPEFNRYERELFPQPGDPPSVIKQKREARRVAIEGMKKAAGPGYKSPTFDDDKPAGNKTTTGVTWSIE